MSEVEFNWHPAYIELPGNDLIRKADQFAFAELESAVKAWGKAFNLYDPWHSLAEQNSLRPEDVHPDAKNILSVLNAFKDKLRTNYGLEVSLCSTWDNYYRWEVKQVGTPDWIKAFARMVSLD